MRVVLVTGGRNYINKKLIHDTLDSLNITMLINGGASGADNIAKSWCEAKGIHTATIPALWHNYGKRAGYLRNVAMTLLGPKLCVAFEGGKGTKMMVDICREQGIEIREVTDEN